MTAITCSAFIHSYIRERPYESHVYSTIPLLGDRRDVRHIRKQVFSKPNNFRILGLSLSDGELDSRKTVPEFRARCSHSSTFTPGQPIRPIKLLGSEACAGFSAAYEETSPHKPTIIAGWGDELSFREGCEEKAEFSLTG